MLSAAPASHVGPRVEVAAVVVAAPMGTGLHDDSGEHWWFVRIEKFIKPGPGVVGWLRRWLDFRCGRPTAAGCMIKTNTACLVGGRFFQLVWVGPPGPALHFRWAHDHPALLALEARLRRAWADLRASLR